MSLRNADALDGVLRVVADERRNALGCNECTRRSKLLRVQQAAIIFAGKQRHCYDKVHFDIVCAAIHKIFFNSVRRGMPNQLDK